MRHGGSRRARAGQGEAGAWVEWYLRGPEAQGREGRSGLVPGPRWGPWRGPGWRRPRTTGLLSGTRAGLPLWCLSRLWTWGLEAGDRQAWDPRRGADRTPGRCQRRRSPVHSGSGQRERPQGRRHPPRAPGASVSPRAGGQQGGRHGHPGRAGPARRPEKALLLPARAPLLARQN